MRCLQPGSIAALEAALAGAAEPAIVGGKIYGDDGVEQRGGRRRRLTMRSAAATFLGLGWLRAVNPAFVNINRNTEPEPAGPVPMDAVSGALMYMSRFELRPAWRVRRGIFPACRGSRSVPPRGGGWRLGDLYAAGVGAALWRDKRCARARGREAQGGGSSTAISGSSPRRLPKRPQLRCCRP